jgi:two-component system sensor histidine kinase AlgZ
MSERNPRATENTAFLPDLCSLQAVVFIVLGTQLLALSVVVLQSPGLDLDWLALGQVSMLLQWISLVSAGLLCKARFWLGTLPAPVAGGLSYVLIIVVAAFFFIAGQYLIVRQMHWLAVLKFLLLTAIVGGVVLRYMYLQQQLARQQQAQNLAQINALQARIRPHFLFNSMNAVASLIGFDPDRAERIVLDLCDLFRASLAKPALVSLDSEIQLVKQYLEIEGMRLDRRLRISWEVNGDTHRCVVPSMLLQPLVENAVYHGIEPRTDGGEIQFKVDITGTELKLGIINPLPDRARDKKGNGIALDNIRARLHAHFNEDFTFQVGPSGEHFRVQLNYDWSKASTLST